MNYKNKHIKTICFIGCSILFSILYSCDNQQKIKQEEGEILIPKENIQILLDSFITENRNKCVLYELYIDKLDPHNYNLILYAAKDSSLGSLTKLENKDYNQTSLSYAIVSGVRINIYSGIEHYFECSNNKPVANFDSTKVNHYEDMVIWVVKDSFGILEVNKEMYGAYPFIGLPLKFNLPCK